MSDWKGIIPEKIVKIVLISLLIIIVSLGGFLFWNLSQGFNLADNNQGNSAFKDMTTLELILSSREYSEYDGAYIITRIIDTSSGKPTYTNVQIIKNGVEYYDINWAFKTGETVYFEVANLSTEKSLTSNLITIPPLENPLSSSFPLQISLVHPIVIYGFENGTTSMIQSSSLIAEIVGTR